MSTVYQQIDPPALGNSPADVCDDVLSIFNIDILNMKPSVVPAQWYIDYTDEQNGGDRENLAGADGQGKELEVTFDGLLDRMSRMEQELDFASSYDDVDDLTDEPRVVVDDSDYELEAGCGDFDDFVDGRRRSCSDGDDELTVRKGDRKEKVKRISQSQPRPLSNAFSKSLGDLLSSLSAFSSDVTDDEEEKDGNVKPKTDSLAQPTPRLSVTRKSISVDINSDDSKSHRRRNGLNIINENNDVLSDLGKFQKNHRKGAKRSSEGARPSFGGMRPGISLESLVKLDKSPKRNFITRRFGKSPRQNMDPLSEEPAAQDIRIMKNSVRQISKVVSMRLNEQGEQIRTVEIFKEQNQSLGFFIKFGDGIDRDDGIFISRVTLGSLVDTLNLLHTGDEILKINQVDVSEKSLEDVVREMQQAELLVIETRSALPFDTHAINIGSQASPASTANQKTASRPSSALNPKSLFPTQDALVKKRSYTSYDPDTYYKDNLIHKLSQSPKSRSKLSAACHHVGESSFYDPSSASDSDESNQSDDKDLTLFHSDTDACSFLSKVKSFTGKLSVEISKISGIPSCDITGSCYCTVEINKEFKARTRSVPMNHVILLDEVFDIDIQVANVMTVKLFQENRILADKCLSTDNIFLERLFQEENHKKFVLSSTKYSLQTQLNIKFTEARRHLERRQSSRASGIFGFNLSHTLSTEKNTIPILVRKCVGEIETRGLDLEGIYRISGNARKKKELRELFERSSQNVDLSDATTWDCHVITGVLKDYLRKLPKPLISDEMYKNLHEKQLAGGLDPSYERTMLSIMIKMAPYVNRATLIFIMDHFQRVLEHVDNNKMTSKNIAVCFGPVMLSPPIEEMKDFQKYIDALELLISIWPKQSNQNMI